MIASRIELLRAVELALADEWDAAHQVVQSFEGDSTAAWIHAVLHKIEGDIGNASYWYHHAKKTNHLRDDPKVELSEILVLLRAPGNQS